MASNFDLVKNQLAVLGIDLDNDDDDAAVPVTETPAPLPRSTFGPSGFSGFGNPAGGFGSKSFSKLIHYSISFSTLFCFSLW